MTRLPPSPNTGMAPVGLAALDRNLIDHYEEDWSALAWVQLLNRPRSVSEADNEQRAPIQRDRGS